MMTTFDPTQIDLAELARMLAQTCGELVSGLIVGRTRFRDALVAHLGCSQLEAELLVDTLVARGFLVKRELATGQVAWAVSTEI
jgi:hypothetical protein